MKEKSNVIWLIVKIILFLLFGVFIIAIIVVTDGAADGIADLFPESFSKFFGIDKKKEKEKDTDEVDTRTIDASSYEMADDMSSDQTEF
ncbi:MAG: hypothetical protein IKO47_01925 [Ruminococcus sp.]|nr:hypothetical protein [Ruminococcus sp.]